MIAEQPPIDVYCYYTIDPAKLDEYADIARQLQEKFLFRPECLLYQFRRGFEEHRRFTMMECGTFRDAAAYAFMKSDVEKRYAELYARLETIIVGGLAGRHVELFHAL